MRRRKGGRGGRRGWVRRQTDGETDCRQISDRLSDSRRRGKEVQRGGKRESKGGSVRRRKGGGGGRRGRVRRQTDRETDRETHCRQISDRLSDSRRRLT